MCRDKLQVVFEQNRYIKYLQFNCTVCIQSNQTDYINNNNFLCANILKDQG